MEFTKIDLIGILLLSGASLIVSVVMFRVKRVVDAEEAGLYESFERAQRK